MSWMGFQFYRLTFKSSQKFEETSQKFLKISHGSWKFTGYEISQDFSEISPKIPLDFLKIS